MSKDKGSQFEFLYQTYREMVFHLCLGFVKGDLRLSSRSLAGGVYQLLESAGCV